MFIQIYTMQTVEEALAIARLGVHHLGLTPTTERDLPGRITLEQAHTIVQAVGSAAKTVALSVESDLDKIIQMVQIVQPDILHLCGDGEGVPPAAVRELRQSLPGVQIMQAIAVVDESAVSQALSFAGVADYLILDSKSPAIDGIGAAGVTHDWRISRKIVESVPIPVILAGGLGSENVGEAIRAVRPWGVDSLTHTNQPLAGGGFRKDLNRVAHFVQEAKSA